MQAEKHVVVIGNGIAGITLAQRLRARSASRITIISAESATHFSRPALMYVYMGHMRRQDITPYPDWYWKEQQITQLQDYVQTIDFASKTLQLRQNGSFRYDVLVLATGSSAVYYNWEGQHLKGVQSLITMQDLELMQQQTQGIKQAVIVGGGLIGIEMAEMLQSKGIAVSMLVRDNLYWRSNLPVAEAELVTQHIQNCGITLQLQEELAELTGDDTGRVSAAKTQSGKVIPCQFAGVATGVKPTIDFLKNTGLELDKGILVDYFFRTNIEDVYAIGDCAQFKDPAPGQPALEQLWYTARQHGEVLAANLCGSSKPYNRGPWFNSAKFLNIEYQTYGFVPHDWDEQNYGSLYWEHAAKTKCIRLFYERETGLLKGINLLGVRYRHDLCHHWLQQNYTIHQVMQELTAVNFDSEFFQHYEPVLLQQYYQQFPDRQAPVKQHSWWNLRQRFSLFSEKADNC
ncbi:NAD(P)/FAD-dependent oxidoreductase [Pontibacter burrus]|uniref:NAD(P)/FAD-dependent oxidoreductase n=1 Tax=Pontibacter burrus TaxID=2704466 RepID=A0A6B3LWK2_9BACT|nr:FAD/NAD(P)-binding oxidoreductase [Pontibacter burrus]NEM97814.1 NAD(P)/FAD-dependent oxidoreductase [Pontibacter burrus]